MILDKKFLKNIKTYLKTLSKEDLKNNTVQLTLSEKHKQYVNTKHDLKNLPQKKISNNNSTLAYDSKQDYSNQNSGIGYLNLKSDQIKKGMKIHLFSQAMQYSNENFKKNYDTVPIKNIKKNYVIMLLSNDFKKATLSNRDIKSEFVIKKLYEFNSIDNSNKKRFSLEKNLNSCYLEMENKNENKYQRSIKSFQYLKNLAFSLKKNCYNEEFKINKNNYNNSIKFYQKISNLCEILKINSKQNIENKVINSKIGIFKVNNSNDFCLKTKNLQSEFKIKLIAV